MGLKAYYQDPFGWVDNLNLSFKLGRFWFNANFFQKYTRLRSTALIISVLALAGWMVCGFDSTPMQFVAAAAEIPDVLAGTKTWGDLQAIYVHHYGKEMHYSAFVLYGFMFVALSYFYEKKLGWTKSRNIAYASMFTLLSVGIFEFFWMYGFSTFQNQPWVSAWRWPQMRIQLQNLAFVIGGVMTGIYVWADSYQLHKDTRKIVRRLYHFRVDRWFLVLSVASVVAALLWIYYPFPVKPAEMETSQGLWTNNWMFPQTLYTIDEFPDDGEAVGTWIWVQDDTVHLINTSVKYIWSATIAYFAMVKKLES